MNDTPTQSGGAPNWLAAFAVLASCVAVGLVVWAVFFSDKEEEGTTVGGGAVGTDPDVARALADVAQLATDAKNNADVAKDNAEANSLQLFTVNSTATDALGIANAANNDAGLALTAATSADTKADVVVQVAGEAEATANDALTTAAAADFRAGQANTNATSAQSDATSAQSDATSALSTAAAADFKSLAAQGDASQALSDASSAGAAALAAQGDATQALGDASSAGAAALAAQGDATSALTEVNRNGDYFNASYTGTLTKNSTSNTEEKLPNFTDTDTNLTTTGGNKVILNENKRYLITVSVMASWPQSGPHNVYLNIYLRYPGVATYGLGQLFSKDGFYKYATGQTMTQSVLKDTTGLSQAARTLEVVFSMDFTTATGNSITLAQGTRLTITELK